MLRRKMERNCLWFVYSSYHVLNLSFLIELNCAASIERARYFTNSYLNQGITKRPYIFIFVKFSNRQRNPLMKNFKTKRNFFIISVTLTLPHPPPPPPPPFNSLLKPCTESSIIVCAFLFCCWCSSSTLLPLPLLVLVSVSLEIS